MCKYKPNYTMLPDDIIFKIYDYVPLTYPINKQINEHRNHYLDTYAKVIQNWYKINKIPSVIPIGWFNQTKPKWLLIRYFFKFYPKKELKRSAYYIVNYMAEHRKTKFVKKYEKIKSNYDVFRLMQNIKKEDIIRGGW